ncbi:hypothetical protein NQZ68_004627 [Dissostichus eleginoides]|nr:hypothetical protein NQZ68_004627 [Dissostichus eleginoides]
MLALTCKDNNWDVPQTGKTRATPCKEILQIEFSHRPALHVKEPRPDSSWSMTCKGAPMVLSGLGPAETSQCVHPKDNSSETKPCVKVLAA